MSMEKRNGLLKACLCIIVSMGGMVVMVVLFMLFAGLTKNAFLLNALSGKEVHSSVLYSLGGLAGVCIQDLFLLLGPIILTKYVWKKELSELGFTSLKNDGKDLLAGILLGAAGITVAFLCLIFSGSVKVEGVTTDNTAAILIGLVTYIIVGFSEETFCRGGIMSALKETKNKVLIIGISSVVFGLAHLGNKGVSVLAIVNLIGFGIFAGYSFYRLGNLWLAIGFHIAWNFVQGSIYGFEVSGTENYSFICLHVTKQTIFTGGAFGPEGGFGVTIALILAFVFVKFYLRKRPVSSFEA